MTAIGGSQHTLEKPLTSYFVWSGCRDLNPGSLVPQDGKASPALLLWLPFKALSCAFVFAISLVLPVWNGGSSAVWRHFATKPARWERS